jgi:hypothetical protein
MGLKLGFFEVGYKEGLCWSAAIQGSVFDGSAKFYFRTEPAGTIRFVGLPYPIGYQFGEVININFDIDSDLFRAEEESGHFLNFVKLFL